MAVLKIWNGSAWVEVPVGVDDHGDLAGLADVAADHPHGISAHIEHANWKVLYTDGSGDEQELSLGAAGTILAGQGVAAAPAFDTLSGDATIAAGGAVTVAGTHSGSAHHAQAHNVASHSDTTATGAELETLTDGSDADALHAHSGASLNDDIFALHAGDVYTGVHDFGGASSFELPNSAAPTVNATGEIALDTTIIDHTPLLRYYSGVEEMLVIAIPNDQLTSTDGHVIAYNATDDEFEMVAPAGGGGGHTIRDDGVDQTDRTGLNFLGAIKVTDDAGGDEQEISLDLNALTTEATTVAADFIAMVDATDSGSGKILLSNLVDQPPFGTPGRTLTLSAGGGAPTATNGCDAPVRVDSGAQDVNFWVMDFDASADEHAFWTMPLPRNWDLGTVTFRVYWTANAAVTTGVAWSLRALARGDNEAIDTAFGTAVVVTDDAQGAAHEELITAESGALTVGGTPAAGDDVYWDLIRDVSDGNDDMTQDARLLKVVVYYTTNAFSDA